MQNPVNAAYGVGDVPNEAPRAVTIFGYRIAGENVRIVMAAILAVVALLVILVVIQLPSGLPFLAAKNATGFFDYVFLFFVYMFGFFFVITVFFAFLAFLGVVARQQIPLLR